MQRSQKKNVSSSRSQSSPGKSKARTQPKNPKPQKPHGLPVASMSYMSRPTTSSNGTRMRDHDLIGTTILGGGDNTPVDWRIPCNPRFWPGTKAYQESLGFQCYYPRSISVRWRTGVSTAVGGQLFGGSLATQQAIGVTQILPALLSVPGSAAGPAWSEMVFKFDLSLLTQPRYFLNSVGPDGIPVNLFLKIPAIGGNPSTVSGLIEIEYDIELFGHCTAPISVPLYDLTPRSWTASSSTSNPVGILSSGTGLATSNVYTATILGSTANNILLLGTSGGSGATLIDFNQFGTKVRGTCGTTATYFTFLEGSINPYPSSASVNLVSYVFLEGNAN